MFNYLVRLEAASSRQPTFLVVWGVNISHANELGEVLANRTGLDLVDVQDIEQTIGQPKRPDRDREGGG